jgi:hypothetical protein
LTVRDSSSHAYGRERGIPALMAELSTMRRWQHPPGELCGSIRHNYGAELNVLVPTRNSGHNQATASRLV